MEPRLVVLSVQAVGQTFAVEFGIQDTAGNVQPTDVLLTGQKEARAITDMLARLKQQSYPPRERD